MNTAFVQLTLARLRDFVRTPEAIFWVFIFPILLTIVIGLAFRSSGPEPVAVGVLAGTGAPEVVAQLEATEGVTAEVLDEEQARAQLRRGEVTLVVIPGESPTFWHDPTRPESRHARLLAEDVLQRAAGREDAFVVAEREMTEKGSRYIDFLVPGLLGMNLMGTGIWGIGFNIVNTRSKSLLRRLVATPMRRTDFLLAQIVGRLVFLLPEVALLLGVAHWLFGVPIRGSLVSVALACLIGAFTFSGLGLLVAARPRTIEGVSGLMNLVMMPMWLASGVFFSTKRFPDFAQPIVQALPLTALNDALRAVLLDGASLLSVAVAAEIANLGVWALVTFVLALWLFRWE